MLTRYAAVEVDPRDVAWELDTPEYEVHFWRGPPGHAPTLTSVRISGGTADALEIIESARAELAADRQSDDDCFAVYVLRRDVAQGLGRIRIYGRG